MDRISRSFLCLLIFLSGLSSCTKVADLITSPTPRERYARDSGVDTALMHAWEKTFVQSLDDNLWIDLPFRESVHFRTAINDIYSYRVELKEGEVCHVEVKPDTGDMRVFIDVFQEDGDSVIQFRQVGRNTPPEPDMKFDVADGGVYRIVVQPEIAASAPAVITVYRTPSLVFPVAGKGNSAIRSFWGAPRAGGRIHEGIDIFAPRGTPVVASASGRVGYTGEQGLGGKQVWLRTGLFGKSLYYAHLDSITVSTAEHVEKGDTLGFVGNTGNARTTSPHLHFGIYRSGGAVDPLPFVYTSGIPGDLNAIQLPEMVMIMSEAANLRGMPSTDGQKFTQASRGDTLSILGKTGTWWHVRTADGTRAFVHESLARS